MSTFGRFYRIARQVTDVKTGFCSLLPLRGLKFQCDVKWVYPKKKKCYHPSNTGDLEHMPVYDINEIDPTFRQSPYLNKIDEKFKKMFSLAHSIPRTALEVYTNELVNRVMSHAYDIASPEVQIATLTAKVRYYQSLLPEKKLAKRIVGKLVLAIGKRNKKLRLLRKNDYKRFEWLLDKLNIEYKPAAQGDPRVTRKKSLMLLVQLQIEKEKEQKIGKLKELFDQQKVPFLEMKLEKLKWIKEQEEKNKLTSTVSDEDIENVVKQIEDVKLKVSEQKKRGYIRKIHPYFLEPYDEALLIEKEQKNCIHQKPQDEV